MKLQGQSILAYFSSAERAQAAAAQLQAAGLTDVQIDRVSRYADLATGQQRRLNPTTGQFGSLAQLTLGVKDIDAEAGIALAASADASGYGGEKEQPEGQAYLLTVVWPQAAAEPGSGPEGSQPAANPATPSPSISVDQAVALLKQHGGRV